MKDSLQEDNDGSIGRDNRESVSNSDPTNGSSNSSSESSTNKFSSDSTNSSTSNPSSSSRKFVDQIAEAANQILDTLGWLGNTLDSSGKVFKMIDAKGLTAEISLAIPAGGVGQVTLVMGQTRKSYPAQAFKPGQEFKRGSKVKIADVGVSTMYVEEDV